MTLYEYITLNPEGAEITIFDDTYDIETYFYNDINDDFEWQLAMMKIAGKLTVIGFRDNGVIVDLTEVIKRNINNGKFKDLFIRNNVDAIMYDIENIFAGCVSDNWLSEFADSLI